MLLHLEHPLQLLLMSYLVVSLLSSTIQGLETEATKGKSSPRSHAAACVWHRSYIVQQRVILSLRGGDNSSVSDLRAAAAGCERGLEQSESPLETSKQNVSKNKNKTLVLDLKNALRALGLSTKGAKAELNHRLKEAAVLGPIPNISSKGKRSSNTVSDSNVKRLKASTSST